MEIIYQKEIDHEGNDCLIKDVFGVVEVMEKYMTVHFLRYIGWCDDGIQARFLKEFDDKEKAIEYVRNIRAATVEEACR